jgi:RNA polymerase sigma-70 factor (ECF subfamily)
VFLLREVFDYDYAEIAKIVQRSEDNCRQLYVRARRHIDQGRPRFEASREQRDELARRFFAAAQLGDTNALVELLAADVVVYGDGGGKAPSWTEPIHGRERVAKLMVATLAQVARLGGSVVTTELNGQPGVMFVDEKGCIAAVCRSRSPTASSRLSAGSPTPTSSPTSAPSPTSARSCATRGRSTENQRLE